MDTAMDNADWLNKNNVLYDFFLSFVPKVLHMQNRFVKSFGPSEVK